MTVFLLLWSFVGSLLFIMFFFFFKQKTAYEMRISDWSSDVCSSDLMCVLGALITFSSRALYAPHLLGPQDWGYSPLEDQQLAGLIMWAPGAAIYLAAALVLLGLWLRDESARPQPG